MVRNSEGIIRVVKILSFRLRWTHVAMKFMVRYAHEQYAFHAKWCRIICLRWLTHETKITANAYSNAIFAPKLTSGYFLWLIWMVYCIRKNNNKNSASRQCTMRSLQSETLPLELCPLKLQVYLLFLLVGCSSEWSSMPCHHSSPETSSSPSSPTSLHSHTSYL